MRIREGLRRRRTVRQTHAGGAEVAKGARRSGGGCASYSCGGGNHGFEQLPRTSWFVTTSRGLTLHQTGPARGRQPKCPRRTYVAAFRPGRRDRPLWIEKITRTQRIIYPLYTIRTRGARRAGCNARWAREGSHILNATSSGNFDSRARCVNKSSRGALNSCLLRGDMERGQNQKKSNEG